MKKVLILVLCILFITGCGTVKKRNKEKGTITNVSCSEKDELLNKGAVLIDVRTPKEYEEYHLDRSVNVPLSNIADIATFITNLPKDGNIIVYCKSGIRSFEAAQELINMGYLKIYNLGAYTNCSAK